MPRSGNTNVMLRSFVALLLLQTARAYLTALEEVDMTVGNKNYILASTLTSPRELIPLDFYRFCYPKDNVQTLDQPNLGLILTGEVFKSSPFIVTNGVNTSCVLVEKKANMTDYCRKLIRNGYRAHMVLDEMDVFQRDQTNCAHEPTPYRKGFQIGSQDCNDEEKRIKVHNYLSFQIDYHNATTKENSIYVVGFEVLLDSREDPCSDASDPVYIDTATEVQYGYSVTWKQSDKVWSNRWETYIQRRTGSDQTGHFEADITMSLLLVFLISLFVVFIMMRTLHYDFNRYNNPDNEDEMQEEVGWKLIHTDVFRPPTHPNRFAAVIGTGVQITGMILSALFLCLIGFMSPGAKGMILGALIFMFVIFAFLNGYCCGRLQMHFKTKNWKTPIAGGIVYPGGVFLLWAFSELLLKKAKSTSVVDSLTVARLLLYFCFLEALLVFGASAAFKQEAIEPPIPYKSLARPIPPQSAFLRWYLVFLPGFFAFVPVSYELSLMMKAIWEGGIYIMFTYVTVLTLLGIILVAETSVCYIYYQLVYEDYRWWWKSFFATSGVPFFYYVLVIYRMVFELEFASSLSYWLYFTFATITCFTMMFVCGTVGFYSTWYFVTRIYNSIRIE
ncbi:Transmembrane 9 superfamily member 7 [Diplonema papillatum]|nr:Transmembrane 9 superfamily member 7 [Diplonema papillatum]